MKAMIVSNALDTNGQNARYARASERWGTDLDVLKAFIVGRYDPADVGGRFREAAKKLGGLAIRSAHVAEAYFDFPRDIRWTRGTHNEVRALAEEADVVHLNNSHMPYMKLHLHRLRKPALLHHHGTLFRNNPDPLLFEARRFHMTQAVSTIDLKRVAPDLLHWLPTAYDMDALKAMAQPRGGSVVHVVSCPTNREVKSTPALETAVALLKAEGVPVELTVVSGQTWVNAMAVKATADIYFDQVGLGYGCNAIEAWGMGIPVIAGADQWTLSAMRKEWNLKPGQPLPFFEATVDTIADAIRDLVKSPALREEYAGIGEAHARKYHDEKPALARLAELYGMTLRKAANAPEGAWAGTRSGPGTFVTDGNPRLSLRLASRMVTFDEGRLTLDDPAMADRLRNIAKMRPKFKIREELPA